LEASNALMSNYEIRLDCGVYIHLDSLFQYPTYVSLLEGLPTRRLNKKVIGEAIIYAEEKLWLGGSPCLIQPVETPSGIPKADWFLHEEENEPATIPAVTCLASFQSFAPARALEADCSSLKIVWFQNEFAMPIDQAVLQRIRAIDWGAVAKDGYW
jgi:hypothetical protein